MRTHTCVLLAALAALVCARAASAQGADVWVKVAPEGPKGFAALMPKPPLSLPQQFEAGGLKVEGRRYLSVGGDRKIYAVWSLNDPNNLGEHLSRLDYVSELFHGEALYLDRIAEIAWEALVRPENEKAERGKRDDDSSLSYVREFYLGGKPAREYTLYIKTAGFPASIGGPVYVCADGPRSYVVAAVGPDAEAPQLRRFVESFKVNAPADWPPTAPVGGPDGGNRAAQSASLTDIFGVAPAPPVNAARPSRPPLDNLSLPPSGTAGVDPRLTKPDARKDPLPGAGKGGGMGVGEAAAIGVGPGRGYGTGGGDPRQGDAGGGPEDYNRTFRAAEVTKRAVVTGKPVPGFNDPSRKFNVNGVVRLRAILSSTGRVTDISVLKGLPHGLTSKAVEAAKQIRFTPAQKDGHAVSQYVVLEYNFNIY